MQQTASKNNENFRFCSSIAEDVYHQSEAPTAYEWWYFDAVSDDGRDALVVIFLDNFIFSPRYNKHCASSSKEKMRFPAVAFCYYRDGRPVYRAINEFSADDFDADTNRPACRVGESRFEYEETPYGARYILNLDLLLRGNRKLAASLEWLSIEHDLLPAPENVNAQNAHFWNLVSPRADVTGKISLFEANEKRPEVFQFRGTGYHDHNRDMRWLPASICDWQWGRAHFANATAVFYRYKETDSETAATQLFLIRENRLNAYDSAFSAAGSRRHYFGIKYPRDLEFLSANDVSLSVKQNKIIDASFFYLRFLSEMRLDCGDGKIHETVGITEHLAPAALRRRWLDWLVNMRIGRNGKGSFLP